MHTPLVGMTFVLLGACIAHAQETQDDPWHIHRRGKSSKVEAKLDAKTQMERMVAEKRRVLDESDLDADIRLILWGEWASDVDEGKDAIASLAYEIDLQWHAFKVGEKGGGFIGLDVFGNLGLNYNPKSQTFDDNIGSISGTSFLSVITAPIAINELYWKQVSEDTRVVALGGKVDLSNHFDGNRVANDFFDQFASYSLAFNTSIPFPAYGGFGGLLHAQFSDDFYMKLGVADASTDSATEPWKSAENDEWYQIAELGWNRVNIPSLGRGQYKVLAWHKGTPDADGWGFAINLDQEMGAKNVIGFVRFGVGDSDVTVAETFWSAGVGWNEPFGREDDTLGVAFSWIDTSPDAGVRNETLIEAYYRANFAAVFQLVGNVQMIIDPAAADKSETVVVLGLRFEFSF